VWSNNYVGQINPERRKTMIEIAVGNIFLDFDASKYKTKAGAAGE